MKTEKTCWTLFPEERRTSVTLKVSGAGRIQWVQVSFSLSDLAIDFFDQCLSLIGKQREAHVLSVYDAHSFINNQVNPM